MSLAHITTLLNKHKLVEGLVHSQPMARQALVEAIVHRKHLNEVLQLLESTPAADIGVVLDSVRFDDAAFLWQQLPDERRGEVLWEISEELKDRLSLVRAAEVAESQINAFELIDGRLRQRAITCRADLEGIRPIWIDLFHASDAERAYVGAHFGLVLPDSGDTTDLEVSSRFHVEEAGEIHLHSNFLLDREGNSRSVPVAFVLHGDILFSVRNEELPVFRLQRRRARMQQGYVSDCKDVLLDLYGADVEYSADALEGVYNTLGKVGRQVLSETISDEEAAGILADIAEEEDLNGRIRSNILDTQRALSFMMRCKMLSPAEIEDAKQILRDIESLNSHTAFLFDKINFLMDATIGFININQNRRVSHLTVFGVVFMPINILAGIVGMSEFSMMTAGIPWPISFGAFVVGMGLIGWGTYVALRYTEVRRARQALKSKAAAIS